MAGTRPAMTWWEQTLPLAHYLIDPALIVLKFEEAIRRILARAGHRRFKTMRAGSITPMGRVPAISPHRHSAVCPGRVATTMGENAPEAPLGGIRKRYFQSRWPGTSWRTSN